MKELLIFLKAAMPWISLGLMLAFFCIRPSINKNKGDNAVQDYGIEGMCIGMCFGMAIGSVIGKNNAGLGTSFGMIIGLAVGLCLRKKNEEK